MSNELHDRVLEANADFHDRFVDHYEDYYHNVIFFEKNRQRVVDNLHSLRQKVSGDVLVDLGCGTGNIGRLASELFPERYGVDISEASLDKAAAHYKKVCKGDVCNLTDFADSSADVITGYSLLHHLVNPENVFEECRRILKPGGCIYFDNDPNSAYFIFHLASYLPSGVLEWLERVNRRHSQAESVLDTLDDSYKMAEYHHHFGGWYEGFFPSRVRRSLNRLGFTDIRFQLFQIDRSQKDVQFCDYSFLAQFRYSQMSVMAMINKESAAEVERRAA